MIKQWSWVIFLLLGLLILVFAWYNAFFIPALDPDDPDMGWAWLTTDPEIIEYIKFNFRAQGMWIFAYGLLVIAAAVGGFRQGERWAWLGLCSVPLVLCLMLLMMPWTLPVLFLPLMLSIVALALSRNHLFMAT
ncbi:MAG: hypothetical protein CL608_29970 [Anaerolineaceae bacterium]|nr:hypothetical protein [Anaerolineaceae bacterium]